MSGCEGPETPLASPLPRVGVDIALDGLADSLARASSFNKGGDGGAVKMADGGLRGARQRR
jgi:hypothetical protein